MVLVLVTCILYSINYIHIFINKYLQVFLWLLYIDTTTHYKPIYKYSEFVADFINAMEVIGYLSHFCGTADKL